MSTSDRPYRIHHVSSQVLVYCDNLISSLQQHAFSALKAVIWHYLLHHFLYQSVIVFYVPFVDDLLFFLLTWAANFFGYRLHTTCTFASDLLLFTTGIFCWRFSYYLPSCYYMYLCCESCCSHIFLLLVNLLLYVYFAAYLPLLNKNVSCILMLMCHCCIYYILTWYESVRSLPFSSSVYICCWSVNLVSNPETFAANMLLCVIFSLLIICYCVSQFLAANQLLLATCTFDLNIFYSEEKDWALHWTRHWLPSPGYTTCTHILTLY